MFAFLLTWLGGVLTWAGYTGFFLVVTLENFLIPIPSEIVLPFAGYLAWTGQFSFWVALTLSALAALLGSLMSYALGRYGGEPFVRRYGHYFLLHTEDLAKARVFYKKYGSITTFLCRFIPGIRQVSSIPAGAARMDLRKFCFYTFVGSALWNGSLMYLGYTFAERWQEVSQYSKVFDGLVILGVLVFAVYWWKRHGRDIVARYRAEKVALKNSRKKSKK